MKVLCVKPIISVEPGKENAPRPEVGDIDVVTLTFSRYGNTYYVLERFDDDNGYKSDHFATLPDATADEIEVETKEAIVNLETALP